MESLLRLDSPLVDLARQLDEFPFDSGGEDRVELTRSHAAAVLAKYLRGDFTAHRVKGWAKILEGRDDVLFDRKDPESVRRLIFELANPEINDPLTPELAREWIVRLGYQVPASSQGAKP